MSLFELIAFSVTFTFGAGSIYYHWPHLPDQISVLPLALFLAVSSVTQTTLGFSPLSHKIGVATALFGIILVLLLMTYRKKSQFQSVTGRRLLEENMMSLVMLVGLLILGMQKARFLLS